MMLTKKEEVEDTINQHEPTIAKLRAGYVAK